MWKFQLSSCQEKGENHRAMFPGDLCECVVHVHAKIIFVSL